MKTKDCHSCGQAATTLYRIQLRKKGPWVFVCKACCEAHRQEPGYRYGGTWKGYRH